MDLYKQYDLKHYAINCIAGNNNGTNYGQFSGPRFLTGHSFIPESVLRKVHSLCQSEFSTQYDLVLPLLIPTIVPFPWVYQVAAYFFYLNFLAWYISLNNLF